MPTLEDRNLKSAYEEIEFRERKVAEREADLTRREQALSAAPPKKDEAHEQALAKKETVLSRKEQELSRLDANAMVKLKDLDAKARKVLEDEARVNALLKQVTEAQAAHQQSVDAVAAQEAKIQDLTRQLADRKAIHEAEVAAFRQERDRQQKATMEERQGLDAKREALRQEQEAVDRAQAEQRETLAALSASLDAREGRAARQEVAIKEGNAALADRERNVAELESLQRTRQQALDTQQATQAAEVKRLADWKRANDLREMQLEKRERLVKQLVEQHQLRKELAAAEG